MSSRARRAADVMQTSLVRVEPSAPLAGVAQLFVDEGIHGAPVVDETDQLLGVVSITDLLRAVQEEHESPSSASVYFRDVLEFSSPDWSRAPADFQDRLGQLTVADVMQTALVTVSEDASIAEVAKLLRSHRIHRVLVVRDGALVGLISALDLVALLEE